MSKFKQLKPKANLAKCEHMIGRSPYIGRLLWENVRFFGDFGRFFTKRPPILEDLPIVCTHPYLSHDFKMLELSIHENHFVQSSTNHSMIRTNCCSWMRKTSGEKYEKIPCRIRCQNQCLSVCLTQWYTWWQSRVYCYVHSHLFLCKHAFTQIFHSNVVLSETKHVW